MINLNTNPQQLMNELQEDRKKAVYWLVKKSGSEKGYIRMQDKLLLDARKISTTSHQTVTNTSLLTVTVGWYMSVPNTSRKRMPP